MKPSIAFTHSWKTNLVLMSFLMIGFLLRTYQLGVIPYGALIDEAHFGYIAKSLLETGRDEHGNVFPLIFLGFGDQKLPFYGYGLIPFVKVFGLNVFSIRILSAIAGTFSILMVYLLLREVRLSQKSALLTSLFVALSPWTFFLSRIGFESNLALFFWLIGLWGFAKSFTSKSKWWLWVGLIGFASTWYTYIAYRPVSMVVLIVIIGMLLKQGKIKWRMAVITSVAFIVLISPFLLVPSGSSTNTSRLKQTSMFADGGIELGINESRNYCQEDLPRTVCDLVWNKGASAIFILGERFGRFFSMDFIIFQGEAEKFLSTDRVGLLFLPAGIFFFLGIISAFCSQKKIKRLAIFSIGLLLVAIVPAIIAGEPQRVRLSPAIPFIFILIAVGFEFWEQLIASIFRKPRLILQSVLTVIVLLTSMEAAAYYIDFFTAHTKKYDFSYQSYVRDLMSFISEQDQGMTIYIRPFFSDPLMYYAFYTNLDSLIYQQNAVLGELEESGFQHTVQLGSIFVSEESPISLGCESIKNKTDGLFVTNQNEDSLPNPEKVFYSQNGSLKYAFAYSLRKIGLDHLDDCSNLSDQDKESFIEDISTN